MKKLKPRKLRMIILAVFVLLLIIPCLLYLLPPSDRRLPDRYSGKIPAYVSELDQDGDGIDDQTDILQSAWEYLATRPEYKSRYYDGGYPDDGYGVCTDVVAFALKGAGYDLSLNELEECLPGESAPEGSFSDEVGEALDAKELGKTISEYLRTISEEARRLFIYRYYDMESLKESAALAGISEAKAKTLLFRTRQGLKAYLEKEGWNL